MEKYKNVNGNSGVMGYEINDASITIWFGGASQSYTYRYQSAGAMHVENMKRLAKLGYGLNAYIHKHVKSKFVR